MATQGLQGQLSFGEQVLANFDAANGCFTRAVMITTTTPTSSDLSSPSKSDQDTSSKVLAKLSGHGQEGQVEAALASVIGLIAKDSGISAADLAPFNPPLADGGVLTQSQVGGRWGMETRLELCDLEFG